MCCNLLVHCISASNDAAFACRAAASTAFLGAARTLGFGRAWLGPYAAHLGLSGFKLRQVSTHWFSNPPRLKISPNMGPMYEKNKHDYF